MHTSDPQYDDCRSNDSEVNAILPAYEGGLKTILESII